MSFTKLDSGIVDSTIWMQPHDVLRVWIAILAKADATGYVRASVPAMAHLCMIDIPRMEEILTILTSPDPYSRTPTDEGRRLREVEGGWEIVNYIAYRNARDEDARREQNREAKRRERERRAAACSQQASALNADSQHVSASNADSQQCQQMSAQAEAEAEAEYKNPPNPPLGGSGGKRKQAKAFAGITFAAWLDQCESEGSKPIPADDPLFQTADDAGIPRDFLRLAWWVWSRDYDEGGPHALKRQKDWRAHFRNAVRRNWLRLWYFAPAGDCLLTTAGVQAMRERDAERSRDEQGES